MSEAFCHPTLSQIVIKILFSGVIELTNEDGKPTSRGQAQGDAVYKHVKEWNCDSKVVALGYATTACYSGKFQGAVVRLHRLLKVPLLYLACRQSQCLLVVRDINEN